MPSPIARSIVAAVSLAALSAPALAATAHNSQAGSYGPGSNPCAATPYFPADDGCLSSAVKQGLLGDDDDALPPPRHYRTRRPVRSDDD